MNTHTPSDIPISAQAIPFGDLLEGGKIPAEFLASDYVAEQFVERLVHYVLSVPKHSYSLQNLAALLEQIDPRQQVYFFKKLKETSPHSLKDFAPLYYGFMAEFQSLLFT